jgi:YD repeat-containing protein
MLADGRIEQARYDAEGNLVQRIDPRGWLRASNTAPSTS